MSVPTAPPTFPNPTMRREYWDMYTGEQRVISPELAHIIGKEAQLLCGLQADRAQPYCEVVSFGPEITDEEDDYQAYIF